MATIGQKLRRIKRRYRHITDDRFFYWNDSDLKKTGQSIVLYIVIESRDKGLSLMEFEVNRSGRRTVKQWVALINQGDIPRHHKERERLKKQRRKKWKPIRKVLIEDVLPAMNRAHDETWRFVEFMGWSWPYQAGNKK